MFRHRWLIALAAFAVASIFVAVDHADARAGRGGSVGSRGSHTYSAPPSTATSQGAAPIQRSATQPNTARPGAAAQTAARPGLFGGGLLGGLAAGFIGAGLFGLLFGHGLFGGMGGFASILGLIVQIALIVIVARLAFAWWQRRNAPATAYAGPTPQNGPMSHQFGGGTGTGAGFGSGLGGGLGGMFGGGAPAEQKLTIAKEDYDAFEQLLGDIQAAYSAEDLNALRRSVTPEMVGYFSEDMAENASRGVINRVTDVKLLQGDLAEAWREDDTDYATVAMRFALTDSLVDRDSGRVVEGGQPSEATELWTFRRTGSAGRWLLSAIQQG